MPLAVSAERTIAGAAKAVVIDLVPVLDAAAKVLVPTFDPANHDEDRTGDTDVILLAADGVLAEAPAAGAATPQAAAAPRSRRARAPRRRAENPRSPRLSTQRARLRLLSSESRVNSSKVVRGWQLTSSVR